MVPYAVQQFFYSDFRHFFANYLFLRYNTGKPNQGNPLNFVCYVDHFTNYFYTKTKKEQYFYQKIKQKTIMQKFRNNGKSFYLSENFRMVVNRL